jgi:hypothetical protein
VGSNVDWWQTVMILSGIGLISVIIGMFAGIPLSKIFLRYREQVSIGKYRMSSKYEPQHTTIDQFDELLKKYDVFESKTTEQGSEATAERGNNEAETTVRQIEPIPIDRILLELEKNLELSIEPRFDKLEPFQTDTWDAIIDIPNILPAELKWELVEAYLDMYTANNIVWFLNEFDTGSPALNDQYVKMCNDIATRLSRIIPMLKTTKHIAT